MNAGRKIKVTRKHNSIFCTLILSAFLFSCIIAQEEVVDLGSAELPEDVAPSTMACTEQPALYAWTPLMRAVYCSGGSPLYIEDHIKPLLGEKNVVNKGVNATIEKFCLLPSINTKSSKLPQAALSMLCPFLKGTSSPEVPEKMWCAQTPLTIAAFRGFNNVLKELLPKSSAINRKLALCWAVVGAQYPTQLCINGYNNTGSLAKC